MFSLIATFTRLVWPAPYSFIGLMIGSIGLMTGGQWRMRGGAIEYYGGATRWFVRRLPLGESTVAITLGHVILGQSSDGLDSCAAHERVHVRQFERWGILMGPAYLFASAWAWLRGGHFYRDNLFEREAYAIDSWDANNSNPSRD